MAANISFVGDVTNGSSRIGIYVPAGAKATEDDAAGTVSVTAPAPDAFLGRNLGGLPIVCAGGLKDRSKLKQNAVGTGMFTRTEAVADDHYPGAVPAQLLRQHARRHQWRRRHRPAAGALGSHRFFF